MLDALVGREQPECENDGLPLHPEPILAVDRGRYVGNAVRDHIDLTLRNTVDVAQKCRAVRAHDDKPLRELGELVHRAALQDTRLAEDGVQRRHNRHAQLAKQCEDVAARLASEDSIFVLHAHDIDAIDVQEICRTAVRCDIAFGDLEPDARRVRVTSASIVHREHEAVER